MKYKIIGQYTIIYVRESVVEASSEDEAHDRFVNELLDVDAHECRANHMGWDEIYVEEEL